jgi:hypothetical protein
MLHQNPKKFDFIQLGDAAPTGDDAEHELLVALKEFLNLDPVVRDSRRKEFARKYGLTLAVLDQEIKNADRIKDEAARAEQDEDLDAAIAQLNTKHAFVLEGGKATILRENEDPITKRKFYDRISSPDFVKAYQNQEFALGVDTKPQSLGVLWMKSPRRRQYLGGVVFDPGNRHGAEHKNLWQGFAYKPAKGSWRGLRKHIWRVVCKRDRTNFKYLMRWLARAVQCPAEQGEVAVVMRGEEGCGKGIVARAILRLFGQHGRHITNSTHFVGRFNEHLQCCVMLFVDEAFFAGDVAHTGVLKGLITEPTLPIEAKYRNVIEAQNFLHVIMASNSRWVVPAALEARRFFVLDVSNEKARQHDYFGEMQEELDNDGYQAMLHDLLEIDLTNFKVGDVPQTEGLQEQKKLSLKTEERWWQDVLSRGYVWKSKLGLEHELGVWHERVTTDLLFTSYIEYDKRERHPLSREQFGEFMHRVGGQGRQFEKGVITGEHRGEVGPQVDWTRKRAYGYRLGTLDDARKGFEEATGLKIAWDDAELELEPGRLFADDPR